MALWVGWLTHPGIVHFFVWRYPFIELEKKANNTFEILICGSQPDLTFLEIAEEFKKFGANKIIWMKSQNPSTMIDVSPLENILNYKPSASYIFKNWMKSEFS